MAIVGHKRAEALVAAIQASRPKGLAAVLAGLSIRGVGPVLAQELADKFGSWERLHAYAVWYLKHHAH